MVALDRSELPLELGSRGILEHAPPGRSVVLRVRRGMATMYMALTLAEQPSSRMFMPPAK